MFGPAGVDVLSLAVNAVCQLDAEVRYLTQWGGIANTRMRDVYVEWDRSPGLWRSRVALTSAWCNDGGWTQ